jgi:hypothetical protein
MKKILLISALGLSVILSSCGWFLKGTRVDLPGNDPFGLNGKTFDLGTSAVGRPEPMSSRVIVTSTKPISSIFEDGTSSISSELSKYGLSVGGLTAWGACLKFAGTAVLTTTDLTIPTTLTLSDVSAELTLKDAAANVSLVFKTDPATASFALTNTAGTNNYIFAAKNLQLCTELKGTSLEQLVGILESGGTNTLSGLLKYTFDTGSLTNGSMRFVVESTPSYIIF